MKEIALHILDIAENCIAAGDGKEEVSRCSDPFFTSRTTRNQRNTGA